tara:strand:- start:8 stop:193 length:186 start_codon:yes stop_codon:yes gene_type:complete
MLDYRGSYGSIEEAQAEFKIRRLEDEDLSWAQIADKLTMRSVLEIGTYLGGNLTEWQVPNA